MRLDKNQTLFVVSWEPMEVPENYEDECAHKVRAVFDTPEEAARYALKKGKKHQKRAYMVTKLGNEVPF